MPREVLILKICNKFPSLLPFSFLFLFLFQLLQATPCRSSLDPLDQEGRGGKKQKLKKLSTETQLLNPWQRYVLYSLFLFYLYASTQVFVASILENGPRPSRTEPVHGSRATVPTPALNPYLKRLNTSQEVYVSNVHLLLQLNKAQTATKIVPNQPKI